MTQEMMGVYTYACPTPEDFQPVQYPVTITTTSKTSVDYIKANYQDEITEFQKQIDELTKQNDIFMGALKYCIAKFSREDIENDWQLGMIEKACQLDEGEVK